MQDHLRLHEAFRKKHLEEAEMRMKEYLIRQCEALESVYSEMSYSSL